MNEIIDITAPEQLKETVANHPLVVADFWAEWCGPCRALSPLIEKLAEDLGEQVQIVKVDVDQNPELSAIFNIQSIPTVLIWRDSDFAAPEGFIGLRPYNNIKEIVVG